MTIKPFYTPCAFLLRHSHASLELQKYALISPLPKWMTSTLDEGDELGVRKEFLGGIMQNETFTCVYVFANFISIYQGTANML